jgi:hypothetical protein
MADHPTDRVLGALVDGTLEARSVDEVQAHVNQCARCRYRTELAAPAVDAPKPASLPLARLDIPDGDRSRKPTPGDIWRLSWDQDDALAVVWKVEPEEVRVLPVVEPEDADEWSLLVGADENTLGTELGISVALSTSVSWAVLDAAIGSVDNIANLESLTHAFKRGDDAALHTGEPILHDGDERLVELEEVGDRFARFANIPWPPVSETIDAPDFETLLRILGDHLVSRALAIARDGARPTDEEADLIASVTGQRPTGAPITPELVSLLNRPRWKPVVRQRAAARGSGEADARRALADEAAPELLAARGSYGGVVDAERVLERLFLNDES